MSLKRYIDDAALILTIAVSIVTVLYLVAPIVVSLAMSFDSRGFLGRFPPPSLSLRWYESFFANTYFLNGLKTSVVIALLTTLASAVIGVTTAVALSQFEFRGKAAVSALFLSPLMVPGVVIGFALLMFFAMIGIFDGFTRLLCGHILITLPYTIRATLAGLTGIRPSLREAALSLGATERRVFWDITFPLARTGILAGCVFAFATSLDDVAVGLFLYDPSAYTLPIALVTYMRASFDLSVAAAAVCLAGFSLALIVLLDRIVGVDKVMGQGIYRS